MGNNQHLKRHAAPIAWPIKRKNITFITKPNPGSHQSRYVIPVVVMLRDVLRVAETAKEVKLIVHNKEVLVNGKKIVDVKSPVGLFDIFEIKDTKEKYVVLFDTFGKIKLVPTKDDILYLKVASKTQLAGKKFQIGFMNGFSTLVDKKTFDAIKVEDTATFDVTKKKIAKILPLKEKAQIYIYDGKFIGQFAEVKGFELYKGLAKDLVQIQINGNVHTTAKAYCFVVGEKKEDLKKFKE